MNIPHRYSRQAAAVGTSLSGQIAQLRVAMVFSNSNNNNSNNALSSFEDVHLPFELAKNLALLGVRSIALVAPPPSFLQTSVVERVAPLNRECHVFLAENTTLEDLLHNSNNNNNNGCDLVIAVGVGASFTSEQLAQLEQTAMTACATRPIPFCYASQSGVTGAVYSHFPAAYRSLEMAGFPVVPRSVVPSAADAATTVVSAGAPDGQPNHILKIANRGSCRAVATVTATSKDDTSQILQRLAADNNNVARKTVAGKNNNSNTSSSWLVDCTVEVSSAAQLAAAAATTGEVGTAVTVHSATTEEVRALMQSCSQIDVCPIFTAEAVRHAPFPAASNSGGKHCLGATATTTSTAPPVSYIEQHLQLLGTPIEQRNPIDRCELQPLACVVAGVAAHDGIKLAANALALSRSSSDVTTTIADSDAQIPAEQWTFFSADALLGGCGEKKRNDSSRDNNNVQADQNTMTTVVGGKRGLARILNNNSGSNSNSGDLLPQRLSAASIFVVGCGALGCEYLKNFAALGMCEEAKNREQQQQQQEQEEEDGSYSGIAVTDGDTVELSNLSRQLLFTEKSIGKHKVDAAAETLKKLHPKTRIVPRRDLVEQGSFTHFSCGFWAATDVIVNAVDNIPARKATAEFACVFQKPLVEAGTLGTSYTFMSVYPHKTATLLERLGGGNNNDDNNEAATKSNSAIPQQQIPVCTLRNFPHIMTHCVHWAKDCFEKLLVSPLREIVNEALKQEEQQEQQSASSWLSGTGPLGRGITPQWISAVSRMADLLASLRTSDDHEPTNKLRTACAMFAWRLLHDICRDPVLDLVARFPRGTTTRSGAAFWSGHKRFPVIPKFAAVVRLRAESVPAIQEEEEEEATLLREFIEPAVDSVPLDAETLLAWATETRLLLEAVASILFTTLSPLLLVESTTTTTQTTSFADFDWAGTFNEPAHVASAVADLDDNIAAEATNNNTTAATTAAASSTTTTPASRLTAQLGELRLDQLLPQLFKPNQQPPTLSFEKDDDTNHHMEFIFAASNLRARTYRIEPATLDSIKLTSGLITPALITATAVATGWGTIETIKLLLHQSNHNSEEQQQQQQQHKFLSGNANLSQGTASVYPSPPPQRFMSGPSRGDPRSTIYMQCFPAEGFTLHDVCFVDLSRDLIELREVSDLVDGIEVHLGVKPTSVYFGQHKRIYSAKKEAETGSVPLTDALPSLKTAAAASALNVVLGVSAVVQCEPPASSTQFKRAESLTPMLVVRVVADSEE